MRMRKRAKRGHTPAGRVPDDIIKQIEGGGLVKEGLHAGKVPPGDHLEVDLGQEGVLQLEVHLPR